MNENLDLTKILKDCPEDTKLYSPIFGDVELVKVHNDENYPIEVKLNNGALDYFAKDGRIYIDFDGKCMLFPSKEQRDWSEFTAPWYKKDKLVEPKFKVGDWIITPTNKVLQITSIEGTSYRFNNKSHYWAICYCDEECRLWTIEDAKDGDVLYSLDSNQPFIYKERNDYEQATAYCGLNMYGKFFVWGTKDCAITLNNYVPATKEQRDALMKAMNDAGYEWDGEKKELKKLKKPKFDPKTLQPFDRVLARDDRILDLWRCTFFSHIKGKGFWEYATADSAYAYCIPYNDDTKYLVGTNKEAPEFYRYWED